MVAYFYKFATGSFQAGMTPQSVGEEFNRLLASPVELTGWMALTVLLGFFVAVMAGLIIFPACFAFGIQSDQGPCCSYS